MVRNLGVKMRNVFTGLVLVMSCCSIPAYAREAQAKLGQGEESQILGRYDQQVKELDQESDELKVQIIDRKSGALKSDTSRSNVQVTLIRVRR